MSVVLLALLQRSFLVLLDLDLYVCLECTAARLRRLSGYSADSGTGKHAQLSIQVRPDRMELFCLV